MSCRSASTQSNLKRRLLLSCKLSCFTLLFENIKRVQAQPGYHRRYERAICVTVSINDVIELSISVVAADVSGDLFRVNVNSIFFGFPFASK